MSDSVDKASDGKGAEASRPPGSRRSATTFVVVFVVCVLVLLTSYRYAVNTFGNIWYIFEVGNSTCWLLDRLGYSCTIEANGQYPGVTSQIRGKLKAWKRGETPPADVSSVGNPGTPLSPWELWQYRAYELRSQGRSLAEQGPFVRFILRPNASQLVQDARARGENLTEQDAAISHRPSTAERIMLVFTKDASLPARNIAFGFTVIPDCGAIPSTAIFCAAILAFPTRWWKRLIGILIGVPILYAVNIFRLACLGIIGAFTNGGEWFHFAHKFVWQGLYIVFVVAIWMVWVEFLVRRRE